MKSSTLCGNPPRFRPRRLGRLVAAALIAQAGFLVLPVQAVYAAAPAGAVALPQRQVVMVKGRPAMPQARMLLQPMDVRSGPRGELLLDRGRLASPTAGAAGAAAGAKPHYLEGEVVVVFKKGTGKAKAKKALAARGLSLAKHYDKLSRHTGKTFALVRGPKGKTAQQLVNELRLDPRVESVSLNYGKSTTAAVAGCPGTNPNDSFFADYQWGLCNTGQTGGTPDADIDATEAWDTHTGSTGVVMAVLDTGVHYTHPDLAPNMWTNTAEASGTPGVDDDGNGYIDDIHGIDTGEDDSDPMDIHGHGTHVAGTIGAAGNDGYGVAGVNWTARIMAVKGFRPDGYMYTSDELDALGYLLDMKVNHGVNLVAVNASYGCTGCFDAVQRAAIEALGTAGVLFVAAAGNSGVDTDATPHYPSSYDLANIISVAATDHNDALAGFSNYGATSVDLAAPGDDILSTLMWTDYVPGAGGDLFFDDMESGPGSWIAEGAWAQGTEQAWSGAYAWSDSPGGNYADNRYDSLISGPIDLSGAASTHYLGFYARHELQAGDALDLWFLRESTIPGWTLNTEQAASPTHAWSDSPGGNYVNDSQVALESPTVNLSSATDPTYLYFKLKGEIESGYDYLNIYCHGGGTWYYLGSLTGAVPTWTLYGAALPAECRTADAKVSFDLVTDESVTYDGYYIDDVSIESSVVHFSDDMESGANGWTSIVPSSWQYVGALSGSTGGNWWRYNVPIDSSLYSSGFRVAFSLSSDASVNADGVYLDDVGVGPATVYEGWGWMSGTSMAAPHVTGVAGFLAGLYGGETVAQRKARILDHVDPLVLPVLTGGRLNLANALTPVDTDGDGVADSADNCTLVANADQRDTNGDGYGNLCDADLNNDGIVNAVDLGMFKTRFGSSDADADFNGGGVVNAVDLGILKSLFGKPPGPSGVAP